MPLIRPMIMSRSLALALSLFTITTSSQCFAFTESSDNSNELSALVSKINSKLTSTTIRKQVADAQVSWASDVSKTCDVTLSSLYKGGTFSQTKPEECRNLMTEDRIRLLKAIFRSTLNN